MPHRLPHGARLLVLLLAVPFHTVVALAMMSATMPVAPETYPLIDDQHRAAAVFWVTGELFTLAAAAVVLRQWWTAEQRAAAREERATAYPEPPPLRPPMPGSIHGDGWQPP